MARHLLTGILLGNVDQEVADTPRVAPLVVVPRDQLDKVLVQLNTGLGVKDRRSRVANEIGGDDILISVLENALVIALGSRLDDGLDFIIGGFLLEADDEINDRDIDGGDTEGKAAVDRQSIRSVDPR